MNKPSSSKDVVVYNKNIFNKLIDEASKSERNRTLLSMHTTKDSKLHTMINVISRGSYVQPHRHWIEKENRLIDKAESFLALEGTGKLIFLNDAGETERVIDIYSDDKTMVWIPEGVWHTLVVTSDYLIVFENKTGPWKEDEDKEFHDAFPAEGESGTKAVLNKWENMYM